MSLDVVNSINWLAVVVSAVIYFAIGAAWYSSAVLGNQWRAAIGWDESRPQPGMAPVSLVIAALAYLVVAIATAMLAKATGSTDIGHGLTLGLVVGIGYAVMLAAVSAAFDIHRPRPWTGFVIDGAYHLVGLLITAVIVTVWR